MDREKLISKVFTNYMKFVEKTSKVELKNKEYLFNKDEQYLIAFWHGDNCCLYPAIPNAAISVITTANKRGNYVALMCEEFGFKPLRVPDETTDDRAFLKLLQLIKKDTQNHVALATDGPLGPYHMPKDFTFILAEMTKRKVLPLSLESKRNIVLFKRWDKLKIPLPFNKIVVNINQPLEVQKEDRKDSYNQVRLKLKEQMEV